MFNGSTEAKNDGFRNFLNNLNPSFMINLFNKKNNINKRKHDLIIDTRNSVTFGSNRMRC